MSYIIEFVGAIALIIVFFSFQIVFELIKKHLIYGTREDRNIKTLIASVANLESSRNMINLDIEDLTYRVQALEKGE